MNAITLVFNYNEQVIPKCICLGFGEIPCDDHTVFIKQAGGGQVSLEGCDLGIEICLGAFHIEIGGIRMTSQAGSYTRCEGVAGIGASATHMAGYASVFN